MIDDSMLKRPYKINPYDTKWVEKFEDTKSMLQKVFASKALLIEHVGSTSIPGMDAKDLVDVCLIVDHMEPFEKERDALRELGYKMKDNYVGPDSLMIYKEKADTQKIENIHVLPKIHPDIDKFILGKEYFLAHPERVQMYKALKASLYQQFPDDYPAYRAGKQDFLKETLELARKWKLEQNQ